MLQVGGLRKRFGSKMALDGLDLKLDRGRILGLVGPNGSGKSTLLKVIAGLVQPTAGRAAILGRRPGPQTKRQVVYLPEGDCLYREMTVGGTLKYVSTFFEDWNQAKALELLTFMELEARTPIVTLSRGMRARLKLVLALARRAPLVLLDEPLSGIDPLSRSRIVRAIVGQYRPEEAGMIISTHEVMQAEPVFDDVVFLEAGRIKLSGQAEELRARHGRSLEELFEEVYR